MFSLTQTLKNEQSNVYQKKKKNQSILLLKFDIKLITHYVIFYGGLVSETIFTNRSSIYE